MKTGRKKYLSLLLSLCMLLNMTAVPVWAESGAASLKKDDATEIATSSNAQVKEEEKGEEKIEEKKTIVEEEDTKETVQTVEGETVVIPTEELFADLPDNDELFAGYVEKMLYGDRGIATYGNWGEERLEGTNLQVYNILKGAVKEIAEGTRSSTIITIPLEKLTGVKTEWTEADAGMSIDSLTNEVMSAIMKKIVDIDEILQYLMVDCPYDLYWYNKTKGGTTMGGPSFSHSTGANKVTISGSLTFSMTVVSAYQDGNDRTMDTRKAKSVQTAVNNAKKIVESYSGKADEEKLLAYKDEICALVSYNTAAAAPDYTGGYGDPWQLIYVFDGDKTTSVVCEGYSKAFQYLCDLSSFNGDVTCYTVNGMMAGGTGAGRHMWNIVTLEGKNYLVDVTNCDEGTIGVPDRLFLAGTSGSVSLGYTFNLSKNITYTYGDAMEGMYGNILALADSNYKIKEDPVISRLPEAAAVYGQMLKEIHLENPSGNTPGTWKWQEEDTKVGDAGSRKFKADFVPEDTNTYRTMSNQEITITVSPKEITNPVVEVEEGPHDYTGSKVTPKVIVKDGTTVIPETEYNVSYQDNILIGTAKVIISNAAGGNYRLPDSYSVEFTIEKADLSRADLELAIPEGGFVYDKTEKKPSVTVKIKGTVINPEWYEVSYSQNINAGENAEVIITASGANEEFCLGTGKTTFAIAKKPVTLIATAEDKTYDGKPDASVTVKTEGSPIIEGDEVSIGEVFGAFTDFMPGEGKEVKVSAVLTGKDAGNYEIKPSVAKATIHSYDPKEVNAAIQKAEEEKKDIQGIDKKASSVKEGTRFVSTAELKAFNEAIEKAKTAVASPLTAEEAIALADELTKATETFTKAIKTGTNKGSSGGSSGGGSGGSSGGGGGGGSRGTSSSRSSRTNSSNGPGSQGTVSTDSKKGQVNSVSGIIMGTTNGSAGDGYSHWQQGSLWDDSSWKLQYADGSYAVGAMVTDAVGNTYEQVAWELVSGVWYAFGADGNAKNSWVLDVGAGRWYYIDINSGMKTGWIALNGIWYYLNTDTTGAVQKPFGAMYSNEMTPDGYFVNADGSWNGMPKN